MTELSSRQIDRRLAALQERLDTLRARVGEPVSPELTQALAELSVSMEELRVAGEELHRQSEAMAEAEAEAQRDRHRYEELFEQAPDGYIVTTRLGIITAVNHAAAELLRRTPQQLAHKPIFLYLERSTAREFRRTLLHLPATGFAANFEDRLRPIGGEPVDVEFAIVASHDPLTGRISELRWRVHDIGPRKRADRELLASREMLRRLSARLQVVQEEERTRIARELHDELGSSLTALKLQVAHAGRRIASGDYQAALESNATAAAMADGLIDQVRNLARALRPSELDELGLLAAVDEQVHDFQARTGVQARLTADEEMDCPPEIAIVIFRVLQELLTNVTRHAQARHVDVRLGQDDSTIVLDVHDDGRGIQPENAEQSASLGLLGIKERVQKVGGAFTIEGGPSSGTSASVTIPLAHPS